MKQVLYTVFLVFLLPSKVWAASLPGVIIYIYIIYIPAVIMAIYIVFYGLNAVKKKKFKGAFQFIFFNSINALLFCILFIYLFFISSWSNLENIMLKLAIIAFLFFQGHLFLKSTLIYKHNTKMSTHHKKR